MLLRLEKERHSLVQFLSGKHDWYCMQEMAHGVLDM